MFTAFMVALTLTAVANVLITMAVGPLFTALFTRVFFAPPIAFAHLGGHCAGRYRHWLDVRHPIEPWAIPISCSVLWWLCVCPLPVLCNGPWRKKSQSDGHNLDLVPSVLLGAVFSTLLTLPLAMPFQASTHDVGLLAILGLFQLAIPCVLSVVCVRVLKAPEASLLCLLEIVFGIALAWWGANEAPQMSVLLGGSLVLGALLMNQWLGWKQNNV